MPFCLSPACHAGWLVGTSSVRDRQGCHGEWGILHESSAIHSESHCLPTLTLHFFHSAIINIALLTVVSSLPIWLISSNMILGCLRKISNGTVREDFIPFTLTTIWRTGNTKFYTSSVTDLSELYGLHETISKLDPDFYVECFLNWIVRNQRNVSIKVVVASKSKADNLELQILQYMRKISDSHHPGRKHICQLLDWFYHEGPNGRHLCIVLELLGPKVSVVAQEGHNGQLDSNLARRVSRQLLYAVDYLHSCGLAHGGRFWCGWNHIFQNLILVRHSYRQCPLPSAWFRTFIFSTCSRKTWHPYQRKS